MDAPDLRPRVAQLLTNESLSRWHLASAALITQCDMPARGTTVSPKPAAGLGAPKGCGFVLRARLAHFYLAYLLEASSASYSSMRGRVQLAALCVVSLTISLCAFLKLFFLDFSCGDNVSYSELPLSLAHAEAASSCHLTQKSLRCFSLTM